MSTKFAALRLRLRESRKAGKKLAALIDPPTPEYVEALFAAAESRSARKSVTALLCIIPAIAGAVLLVGVRFGWIETAAYDHFKAVRTVHSADDQPIPSSLEDLFVHVCRDFSSKNNDPDDECEVFAAVPF